MPGVEWPHPNHPLPRVVGGGPLQKWSRDGGAARHGLALTVVRRLALLAVVTTTRARGRRVCQVAV